MNDSVQNHFSILADPTIPMPKCISNKPNKYKRKILLSLMSYAFCLIAIFDAVYCIRVRLAAFFCILFVGFLLLLLFSFNSYNVANILSFYSIYV